LQRDGKAVVRAESQKTCLLKEDHILRGRRDMATDLVDEKGISPDRLLSVRGFFLLRALKQHRRGKMRSWGIAHLKQTILLIRIGPV
jgi:hypothetical protein